MPPVGRNAVLLGALSLVTDLGGGFPPESALRTSLVAVRLVELRGGSGAEARDAYEAGLLRYLGCSAYAHEGAALAAGDDHAFLQIFSDVDLSKPVAMLSRSIAQLGRGHGLRARLGAVARFVADPGAGARVSAAHCDLAVSLASRLGMGPAIRDALAQMYERWDGRGQPAKLRGDAITSTARVLQLAQVIETFHRMHGLAATVDEVRSRCGHHFEPELADAFVRAPTSVVAGLDAPSVWDAFVAAEPRPHRAVGRLREIAAAFADYADLKSPFTIGHSPRVASLARAAGEAAGLSADDCVALEIAGLLHDLGRVAVPNGTWDKPGPLNHAERERVRMHAVHTERVLAACPLLEPFAELAAADHERLGGRGYPRRLPNVAITPSMRVLAAADVCVALHEDRAHRRALSADAAHAVLAEMVSAGELDRTAVDAVLAAAGRPRAVVRSGWPRGLTDREVDVVRLVARGLTNKEIGTRLEISARTVQTHLAHVFEKTGINTRASAALFAVEHALLGVP